MVARQTRNWISVSIHAPAWGATNSPRYADCGMYEVSIHAPAWGATHAFCRAMMAVALFQSTLPRGERPPVVKLTISPMVFQSTLPRGERPPDGRPTRHRPYRRFNPRSRVGSDTTLSIEEQNELLFQSTLPRGERLGTTNDSRISFLGFNPRSRVGSDSSIPATIAPMTSFNPRSRVGSDLAPK